jgi:ankyrin repeat protein
MGKTKTVDFLISKGANIEAKRHDGSTPLHEGIILNYRFKNRLTQLF